MRFGLLKICVPYLFAAVVFSLVMVEFFWGVPIVLWKMECFKYSVAHRNGRAFEIASIHTHQMREKGKEKNTGWHEIFYRLSEWFMEQ